MTDTQLAALYPPIPFEDGEKSEVLRFLMSPSGNKFNLALLNECARANETAVALADPVACGRAQGWRFAIAFIETLAQQISAAPAEKEQKPQDPQGDAELVDRLSP